MKNGTTLAVIALGAVALWMWSKKEPSPKAIGGWQLQNPTVPLEEAASPDPWTAVPQEIPLSPTLKTYGGGTYQPVVGAPVPIGDTGFFIWGATSQGVPIISTKPPETYEAWEWM